MRISDWSSDVCSSDLSNRSAASPTTSSAPCEWSRCTSEAERITHRKRPGNTALVGWPRARILGRLHRGHHRGQASRRAGSARSEEHTSELQSLMRISYAVFCLKKKKLTRYNRTRKKTQIITCKTRSHMHNKLKT